MKAIRRSLKGEKEPKPQHISITPKSAIAILPPKKVIKALYNHRPEPGNTQELAFSKGDFFHVISREDDTDWYEACNPLIPSARGLVPVSFFEVIGKNERNSGGSAGNPEEYSQDLHDSGFSDRSPQHSRSDSTNTTKQAARARMSAIGKGSGAMVYGIVQYDFTAERPDELDAKAGEAIIVIAQSNPEWFVAKPIGRLGGPGLIPVSFIEIRDMTTGKAVADPHDAVRKAGVPRVEEWKKMTAEYKNSSITLGKFEGGAQGAAATAASGDISRMTMNGSDPYQQQSHNSGVYSPNQQQYQNQAYRQSTQQSPQQSQNFYPPALAPVFACIPRFDTDHDKHWFVIRAKMEDGRYWELSRYYHDFYDFQIALLREFEEEAGNKGKPRTLPFMPGPVTHVTEKISSGRRQNLDEYIKKLLSMPPHISRCQLVRQLFAPRPGDVEIFPTTSDDYRLSGGSQQSSGHVPSRSESTHSTSRGHINTGSYPPGSMGPPPSSQRQAQGHPHHQQGRTPSQSQSNGNGSVNLSRSELQNQMMNRQQSAMTQTSSSSTTGAGAIKIKVFFQDDLIAIRVPSDISYAQLREKLKDRLKLGDEIMLQYKDEPSNGFAELLSDHDLDTALQRNAKLTLYVGLA
ncbi:bud emergence protein 1, variant 2 [Blastomyces dermatitidis ATCC 26199]|nr:bud emergence protein 1 [Blastomyces dermatitidis ATCC 26199]EQL36360.1 bud emergence protein 1, variant 1 [Blastomyces dermatitidis ATCC 26199]EQL36361.1 bud emergence protein 1, variant 2 [Blastomyces dermatitidis ATCC 26199]